MDILDIDEVLKDDSFIFLEDKTHDDVSNILQQWKNNNCIPTQLQYQQQQQQNQEQAFKLNSRTFTRPKRKSAQNLELQFTNSALHNGSQISQQQQNGSPMFNMEIGGLVTTMHKSFLQDTSPPSSICSSMDVSVDRMNNSLITSADFSNLSFLQSTHSMEFGDVKGFDFNLSNKSTSDGYTLSDMIRDRKALESLTMSSDGTLIKDSHIAQIDDISLTFSKTASGSSTMDNSTESMDCNNRTIEVFNKDRTFEEIKVPLVKNAVNENVVHRTMVLNDELISDTTFNLVENSIYGEQVPFNSSELGLNVTHNVNNVKQSINETFKKPTRMNDTVCVVGTANTTFDCQQTTTEPLCETPESIGKNVGAMKIYESTPQASNVRYNRLQYTPTLKNMTEDLNISPIIGSNEQRNTTRVLNETFERDHLKASNVNSKTFANVLPQFESMEMIDNIQNPNITFQKSFELDTKSAAGKEMQNVMDLAQAEAELLAGNDEEFDHKLDEFSKIEMNFEQLRMKKSLETIKKRFSCGIATEKHEQANTVEGFEKQPSYVEQSYATSDNSEKSNDMSVHLTKSSILKDSPTNAKELKNSMLMSKELRDSTGSGFTSSTASASSSTGERLLSRRSRLYDDFNLSVLNQSKSPSTSITAPRTEADTEIVEQKSDESKAQEVLHEKTEENIQENEMSSLTQDVKCPSYKLTEKRNRDRDRFKTIKIVKPHTLHNENNAIEAELNVPCIDDDGDDALLDTNSDSQNVPNDIKALQNNSRYSRRDKISPVFNNNNSEIEESTKLNPSKTNPKYLTYKKPKDKQQSNCELPEIYPPNNEESTAPSRLKPQLRLEPRSLSRPRYISGLQKFSVVSKATSAGDLDNSTGASTVQQKPLSSNSNMSRKSALITGIGANNSSQTKTSSDIKSPMGIKSKSFHNLSSNFGYTTTGNGTLAPKSTYGLKKPNNAGTQLENQAKLNSTKLMGLTNKPSNQVTSIKSQKTDDSVFKVPKLVSGIRAPGALGSKRAGLVRPSSGYYSLNVTTKTANQVNEVDPDAGRHSPTDSMSSASSRSSAQSSGPTVKPTTDINSFQVEEMNLPAAVTKLTTDSTGIPKPSRLRPPTSMKRSGLPRPSSIVKR